MTLNWHLPTMVPFGKGGLSFFNITITNTRNNMAGISFIGTVIEEPTFKTVGKKNTPLATVKVSEEIKKKEGKKWVVTGHNHYEITVWYDKAVEASGLSVGDKLDMRSYVEDDYIKHRAMIQEETWEWKGKTYSALKVTAFDWEVLNDED